LLRRYAAKGTTTVGGIINTYGGGQDYSAYISFVTRQTGFTARKQVPLDNDDVLLTFGKAMFRYEAGQPTPLKDEQILYGLRLGEEKGYAGARRAPPMGGGGENSPPASTANTACPARAAAGRRAHARDP